MQTNTWTLWVPRVGQNPQTMAYVDTTGKMTERQVQNKFRKSFGHVFGGVGGCRLTLDKPTK